MIEKLENIPPEIYNAFQNKETGYSLLIKGNAGVGKSTLAFTILGMFEKLEPIYISTRVTPDSLYTQFPWIKDKLKEENILDATRTYLPPLNDPKQLKTHVLRTIRFLDPPEFLKLIYDRMQKYNDAIVVIDSWDAVVGPAQSKSQEWETLLTEFVRRMKINLILISENIENSCLDYIVDGIITLKDNETEGRTLREMEINKIRGIERNQKHYNYTLYENVFKYCRSLFQNPNNFNLKSNKSIKYWKPVKSKIENSFSTGSRAIDNLYNGGLKPSTLNLWEIESDVPLSAFSNIMIPLICNFISKNFGTIIYSSDGLNTRFIDKNKLFINLDPDRIKDFLRYMVETIPDASSSGISNHSYVIPFLLEDFIKTFSDTYNKIAEKTSFNPVLSVISYDFLNFMNDNPNLSLEFYRHLKFVRNYNVIEIGIVNRTKRLIDYSENEGTRARSTEDISYFFDTHIKMIFKNNAIYLYGIKPYSGIFWLKMEYDKDSSLPRISLVPMV